MSQSGPHNDSRNVINLLDSHQKGRIQFEETKLALLKRLQTSLQTEVVLAWFSESCESWLGEFHLRLETPLQSFSAGSTKEQPHKASYNLNLDKDFLGELIVSRRQKFSHDELSKFEECIALLVYPLRNCLHYQDAIQAAMSDALTGAANKRAFDYQLHREAAVAKRNGSPLSLAILDVDFFKKINDSHGHQAGDAVLKELVKVVKETCRDSDQFFRLGGEEFALLLTNTDAEGAFTISDRIRKALASHLFHVDGKIIPVTVSAGVATLVSGESRTSFIDRADQALYKAKRNGRNQTRESISFDRLEAPSSSTPANKAAIPVETEAASLPTTRPFSA